MSRPNWAGAPNLNLVGLACIIASFSFSVRAADNVFSPRLGVETTLSDNIFLDPDGEEDTDFVLQVNPGFSWQRRSQRLNLGADLNVQNIFYADNSSANDTFLQGNFQANTELVKESILWDWAASATQRIISSEDRIGDNVNITGNVSNVYTFGTSPYWLADFGGYAETEARYAFSAVRIEEGADDSNLHQFSLRANSGRRFTRLNWTGEAVYGRQNRDSDDDTTRRRLDGDIGYRFSAAWEFVARGGYRKDNFASRDNNENGWFWSAGAVWSPSTYFSIGATYGPDDKEIRATVNPSPRTGVEVYWRDRNKGANPGTEWFAQGTASSRYATWSLSYRERVTSSQAQEIPQTVEDPAAGTAFDDQGRIGTDANVLGLTDDEFRSKRLNVAFDYEKGKSSIGIGVYNERRDFDQNESDDRSWGADANWTWRFAPRTQSVVEGRLRTIRVRGESENDILSSIRVALVRQISQKITGSVEYRYFDRDGQQTDVDYTENRLSAIVAIAF